MYKVLLVDDEQLILDGMRLVINWEELGLEVAGEALNGTAALDFIENNTVDIVITDIRMPVMNGLALLKSVKEKHGGIKAIILSGYDDFEYVKEAAKYGIENYLLKPVNDEELLSTLLLVTRKLDNEARTLQRQRQDVSIIRDNILLRWVTDTISASELESRGDLLHFHTTGTCYAACIVHTPGRPENDGRQYPERYQAQIEAICAAVTGEEHAHIFKNLDGDTVLLFHFDGTALTYEQIRASLHNALREITGQLGLTVFILAGSVQRGHENVHKSYADALRLMDYTRILSGSHVVDYSRTQQEMKQLDTGQFIDLEGLRHLVLEKNITGVHACIDGAFARLGGYDRLTPAMLRKITMQIGLTVLNLAGMSKSVGKGYLEGTDAVFTDVWDRKSIAELADWVKGVAGTVVDYLRSADKVYSPVVKKVVQYIDGNYDKEIALKCIAGLLNMNAVYLGQLFKTETGLMFSVYLNQKRVEEAKKLLLATKLNVADIGVKVGYSNNNHFFSVFKKFVGISPTEYRRVNAGL